jgi:hypothetical protein
MNYNKNDYFLQKGITCFLVCSCLFIGCSAPEKRLTKDQLTIAYQSKSSLESEIRKLRLQHPVKISAEQMANQLHSLKYKELTLTGKKKYIFSPSDVLEIAPIMTKALNRIKSSKVLHYEVETPRGKTAGIVFRAKGKINWRFDGINGSRFLNTNVRRGSTWALLPQIGQRFHKGSSMLGNAQKKNWIISNLELQVYSKRGPKPGSLKKPEKKFSTSKSSNKKSSTSTSSSEKEKFKKRLQFWKELRQKKLIDDEEYKHKKTELLEQIP